MPGYFGCCLRPDVLLLVILVLILVLVHLEAGILSTLHLLLLQCLLNMCTFTRKVLEEMWLAFLASREDAVKVLA